MESKVWWIVERVTASSLAGWAFSCWALPAHRLTTLTQRYTFLFGGIYCKCIFSHCQGYFVRVSVLSRFMESVQPVVNVIWNGRKNAAKCTEELQRKLSNNSWTNLPSLLLHKYIGCVRNAGYYSQKHDKYKYTNNTKIVAWHFNIFKFFSA